MHVCNLYNPPFPRFSVFLWKTVKDQRLCALWYDQWHCHKQLSQLHLTRAERIFDPVKLFIWWFTSSYHVFFKLLKSSRCSKAWDHKGEPTVRANVLHMPYSGHVELMTHNSSLQCHMINAVGSFLKTLRLISAFKIQSCTKCVFSAYIQQLKNIMATAPKRLYGTNTCGCVYVLGWGAATKAGSGPDVQSNL